MKRVLFTIVFVLTILPLSAQNTTESYSFRRGLEAWRQDDLNTAYRMLNVEINEHPTNGYAYAVMAFVLNDANMPRAKFRAANRAMKYLPKNESLYRPEVCRLLFDLYCELGDSVKVEEFSKQLYPFALKQQNALRTLCEYYEDNEQYEDEITLCRKVIKAKPKDYYAYTFLFNADFATGSYDKALADAEQIILNIENDDDVDDRMRAIAKSDKVHALVALKRYDEALPLAMEVLSNVITRQISEDIDTLADHLDYKQVIEALTLAEQTGKVQSWWALFRGQIYDDHHEPAQAYIEYQQAMFIQENSFVWRRMANLAINSFSDAETAETCLNHALLFDSTDVVAQIMLADLYHDLNRYDDALAAADKAVRLNPNHEACYQIRSRIYRDSKEPHKEIEDLYSLMITAPDDRDVYFRLADAYRHNGDSLKAQQYISIGVAAREAHNEDLTAEDYILIGDSAKAYEAVKERIESDSRNDNYNAACVLARLGRTDEALATLEKSMQNGFLNFYHLAWDEDLDNLRGLTEFDELLLRYKSVAEERKQQIRQK